MKNQLSCIGLVLMSMAAVLMVTEASVFAQRQGGGNREGRGQRQRSGQAQQGQRGSRGQGDRQGQGSPLLRLFDGDNDGVLSAEEVNAASGVLSKMDQDGDGKLSADELRPRGGRGGRGQGRGGEQGQSGPGSRGPDANMSGNRLGGGRGNQGNSQGRRGGPDGDIQFANELMELDIDGDGTLIRSELPEHMQVAFDQVDANGDGVASSDERVALASKFRRNQLNPNGDAMKNAPTQGR